MSDHPPQRAPSAARLNRDLADRYAAVVGGFVSRGQPYALLDFPDHPNIGDSAIYAGELAFLDRHVGRAPSYVCALGTYRDDVEAFCPEGPLFLHGGGNFGSTWRQYQRFRHRVIARYPHRRIVQLAQSIHYSPDDRDNLEEGKRLIGAHPDFTLLVRDQHSYDFAKAAFDCEVILCPDAAHCLLELPPRRTSRHQVLSLMRQDKEAVHQNLLALLRSKGPVIDWGRQRLARTLLDRISERYIGPALPGSGALMRRRERMYRRQAAYRLACGVRMLSRGQIIVSDRLHAHLIAGLMGKPHISLDNSYGKIGRYIAAWGKDEQTLQVSNLQEVEAALEQLKDRVTG